MVPYLALLHATLIWAVVRDCCGLPVFYVDRLPPRPTADGSRAAFFLGDGAGVGKGRQIASIIMDNWLRGRRRHIWVSVSADLVHDARRDLHDLGAVGIRVASITDFDYGKIDGQKNRFSSGVLFLTYRSLISETKRDGKQMSRYNQVVKWFGRGTKGDSPHDGALIFDEAHKAKNLGAAKPTKTGLKVLQLQRDLPQSRIIYASATGASGVYDMAYMDRIGLWGPGLAFSEFRSFGRFVERQGVGCMELLASELKGTGAYLSRTLSYAEASFEVVKSELTAAQQSQWDAASEFWIDLLPVFEEAVGSANLDDKNGRMLLTFYWGAHQRFFRQLCICLKVDCVVDLVNTALADGKCAVIGMQSTGEAALADWLETTDLTSIYGTDIYESISSLPREIAKQLIKRLPTIVQKAEPRAAAPMACDDDDDDDGDDDGNVDNVGSEGEESDADADSDLEEILSQQMETIRSSQRAVDEADEPHRSEAGGLDVETASKLVAVKSDLLARLEELMLPNNPLDEIIDRLGGVSKVAELSGRGGRMVKVSQRCENGIPLYRYTKRKGTEEAINIEEKQRFQDDIKQVAIITDACSTGISLQADHRVQNQRRRVHITLELPVKSPAICYGLLNYILL